MELCVFSSEDTKYMWGGIHPTWQNSLGFTKVWILLLLIRAHKTTIAVFYQQVDRFDKTRITSCNRNLGGPTHSRHTPKLAYILQWEHTGTQAHQMPVSLVNKPDKLWNTHQHQEHLTRAFGWSANSPLHGKVHSTPHECTGHTSFHRGLRFWTRKYNKVANMKVIVKSDPYINIYIFTQTDPNSPQHEENARECCDTELFRPTWQVCGLRIPAVSREYNKARDKASVVHDAFVGMSEIHVVRFRVNEEQCIRWMFNKTPSTDSNTIEHFIGFSDFSI